MESVQYIASMPSLLTKLCVNYIHAQRASEPSLIHGSLAATSFEWRRGILKLLTTRRNRPVFSPLTSPLSSFSTFFGSSQQTVSSSSDPQIASSSESLGLVLSALLAWSVTVEASVSDVSRRATLIVSQRTLASSMWRRSATASASLIILHSKKSTRLDAISCAFSRVLMPSASLFRC